MKKVYINEMHELVLDKIEGMCKGSTKIVFHTNQGYRFEMYHDQECCEQVEVEDVEGRFEDLIGVPLLLVEESVSTDIPGKPGHDDLYQWTFYRFGTIKGYVTIRWYGESNGYYGVRVDVWMKNRGEN